MKTPRSKSLRRIKVKVPGGTTRLIYKRKKPKKAKCGICGAILKGVPRKGATKMKKLAKTKKRPQRPYGGILCSRCMRKIIIGKARSV